MQVMDTAMAAIDWRQSVEALYRDDADRLWRAVRAFAGDPETATEAVAEAYVQLLGRGPVVRDPASWVWRSAFRIAAGTLKAGRAVENVLAVPGEHLDRYEDSDLLGALRQLPQAQRAAVILFYYADLPVAEVARRLGSNRLAVRANLSRGRRRLLDLLGDRDG